MAGQGRPRMYLSCFFSLGALLHFFPGTRVEVSFAFPLSFLLVVGGPTMTGKAGTGAREKVMYINSYCRCSRAAAPPLPHVAG